MTSAPRILLLGDFANLREKLAPICAACAVTVSESHLDVLRRLRDGTPVDLVLLCPGSDLDAALETCRAIKFDRRTSFTPVVIIRTPEHEPRVPDVHEAGADDYVPNWVSPREIELRLNKSIKLKRATDMLEDAEAVIVSLAKAIEGKDECTCGHVDRVSTYCVEIGKRFGLGHDDILALRIGGVVHDIGKVGVPDHILNKPGRLTDEEMAIMRRHPVIGHDILAPMRTFRAVLPIVRWHHERPNGSGYPDALAGDALPLLPRIAAVADVFDALSTDRPYRAALPLGTCQRILLDEAAKGNLDARVVETLFQVIGAEARALAG